MTDNVLTDYWVNRKLFQSFFYKYVGSAGTYE